MTSPPAFTEGSATPVAEGPSTGPVVIFAHGAGAGPDSEFMQQVAKGLVSQGIAVVRFEFPYWTKIRTTGKRRPPNRQPQLQQSMLEVAAPYQHRPLWLMGKSMGARVAFTCADRLHAMGAIGLGFPFHPQGKPERHRLDELHNRRACNLIVQGTHDGMGKQAWVEQQSLPANLHIEWVATGNHDLVPHKSSGLDAQASWHQVVLLVSRFIKDEEWRLSL